MEKTKNNTYQIVDLNQMCNIVNDDNVELLINDFAKWLLYYNQLMNNVRKENPELTKGKLNTQIAECKFIWTDDGKNELTGVELSNKDTGKVEFIKTKTKN